MESMSLRENTIFSFVFRNHKQIKELWNNRFLEANLKYFVQPIDFSTFGTLNVLVLPKYKKKII